MAETTLHHFTSFLSTLLLAILILHSFQVHGLGRIGKVGGRTKVKNVKSNQEIQELGRYCVEEYNRIQLTKQRRHHGNGGGRLSFDEVVEAETQVVSGIKYYLKISAVKPDGVPKTFDAVVVVKAWENYRELLSFSPSQTTK